MKNVQISCRAVCVPIRRTMCTRFRATLFFVTRIATDFFLRVHPTSIDASHIPEKVQHQWMFTHDGNDTTIAMQIASVAIYFELV